MTTLVGFAVPTYSNDVSESAGSLTHNLSLSAPSSQTVTVTVRGSSSTSAGNAGSADLGVADQVITFAPGQTTATFTTAVYEDSLYEGSEFYYFEIISATGAEIDLTNTDARYLTGNILDNDQPTSPLVGFAAPTYSNDVSESAGSLTHNLSLSARSSQTVTVTVRGSSSTSAGNAGSADLGVADQVITFAPGQTTATFTTAVYEDSLYEGSEFYYFEIISATGAEIDLTNTDARYLTGNILDNDQPTSPLVGFAAPTYSNDVSESAGSLTHNLSLSARSSQTVTVTVRGSSSTSAGNAGSADLGVADQVITFAPGQTTATFTTAVYEDSLYEGSEFYYFEIISATGAEIDLTNTDARYLTGNILDNDSTTTPNPTVPLTVRFAAPNSGNDVSESAGSLTHSLTLSAPTSETVTVTVRGQNGTGTGSAGSADLGVADQLITFAPGQTTATFTTAIHEDSLYEGSEFYYFEIISATGAQIDLASGARQFYGNILDNDQPASPTVRFAAPNSGNDVSESAGSLTHSLTLSAPTSEAVTVTVRGQNGTGTGSAGSADLGVADQVITFAPGQTTATFTTAIHEDSLYEGSEFYYFEIISATGVQIDLASGARQFYGNILDNDQPASPTIRFAAPNSGNDVSESAGSLTHSLTLSAPTSETVTVTVRGQNGTGTGSAGSADLGVADQVITFAPGQTTATFTTAIHEDSLYEGSEFYYFEIISATGAQIDLASGARQFYGSILDNDQLGANNAPVVTSNGGGDTAATSIVENTTTVTTVTATDSDPVQTLSYSIIGGADAGKFTIGFSTGALSFVTAPNFELPTDAGGNNVYDVIVQASDGYGIDTQAIAVTVTDVIENSGPINFTLTTGSDTVTGTALNDTVNGTALTLNSGDSLTGGAGTDVLALFGGGIFQIDQLATFTGFENITLNIFGGGGASLYLGSQSVAVTGYGGGSESIILGSGAVTFKGGGGFNAIDSYSISNWNAGNSIDGAFISLNSSNSENAFYDLTTNTLSNITALYCAGANLTLRINSAVADGIATFTGDPEMTARLVTSDAVLDLSHSRVSNLFTVASSNTTGTNFTVHDIDTAFQIAGGLGTDTITAQGFAFSADQRNAIFTTASVERIVDASGTYTPYNVWPNITSNGGGNMATVSIAENTTAVTTVTATDPDIGQALSYSIIGGADASKFKISSSTGALSFVTAPNFELPTDVGGNNVYDVIVQASDGNGGIDTQAIAVTVADVNDTLPTITSNGGGNTAAINIVENITAVTTVTATDPDVGQATYYSIIGGADASKFAIGSTTGALSFVTAPNFELPNDASGNNVYDVIVQASDGHGGIDTQALAVGVQNVAGVSITGTASNETIDLTRTLPFTSDDNNTIYAYAGNDYLNGGSGADTMFGGLGNDIFIVNHAADRVFETAGQGTDTVYTSVSYALAAGQQIETLATTSQNGFGAINLSGNEFAQKIYGNNAANVIKGGGGNDVVSAFSGNDIIYGGTGNDTLIGGFGYDTFVFNTALNSTNNVDRIADFNVAQDTIWLENAVMRELGSHLGTLAPTAFWKSTTGLAHDRNDHIIYETDTGWLNYDSNGSAAGGAVHIAKLAPNLELTYADFLVI